MGKIFSTVTDAIGLTDTKGEKQARQAAEDASMRGEARADEATEFQKEQYADWKNVYGELTDNLGDYYNNLDSETIAVRGLQAQQKEYQSFRKEFNQKLAQKGIQDSKFAESQLMNLGAMNAMERARIRASAPEEAARAKTTFLGIGLGQGQAALGNIAQTSGLQVSAAGTTAGVMGSISSNIYSQDAATKRKVIDQAQNYLPTSFLQ